MKGFKHWTTEEDKLLLSLYEKVNRTEIAKQLHRSKQSISNRLYKLGIKGDTSHTLSLGLVTTTINEDYFATVNSENSYFGGFIAADACLSSTKYQLSMGISMKDISLLKEFKSRVDYSGDIHLELNRGFKSSYTHYAELRISGVKKWHTDLKRNFSITPRKTYTLQPPKIFDKHHILCFLKGLLDGDGWISFGWDPRYNRPTLTAGFCGTYTLLSWIKDFCDKFYSASRISQVKDFGTYSYYALGDNRAERFLVDCMHSVDLGLKRKWSKLNNYRIIKYGDLNVY